jgi:membrane-associated protein
VLSRLLDPLLHLPAWEVYLLVGALAYGEAAVFLGFVLPGETAVILGGVAANVGHASVLVVGVVAVVAAIAGDSTGYEVGRLAGPALLELRAVRRRRRAFDAAQAFLERFGGRAVFVGRFTAFLRAVVPGLAGLGRMPYPRFLLANATGGLLWAVGYTALGYALGTAYHAAERYSTIGSSALLGGLVVAVVALRVRAVRRERRRERTELPEPEPPLRPGARPEPPGPGAAPAERLVPAELPPQP